MSDYTRFTRLDYSQYDDGQRFVDKDAISAEFARMGGTYYGDGSEFIVGYDANGNAMVDTNAVQAAARRQAESIAESKRCEDAFQQLIANSGSRNSAYLYHGRDIIFYYHFGDKTVYGTRLIHASANCPYLFDSRKIGPFIDPADGLAKLDIVGVHLDGTICPCCFSAVPEYRAMLDDEIKMTGASILQALKTGRWHYEDYYLKKVNNASAPKPAPKPATKPAANSGGTGTAQKVATAKAPAAKAEPERKNVSANGNEIKGINIIICPDRYLFSIRLITPKPIREGEKFKVIFSAYVDVEKKRLIGRGTKEKERCLRLNDVTFNRGAEAVPDGAYNGAGYAYFIHIFFNKDTNLGPDCFELKLPNKEGYYSTRLIVKGDIFPEGYEQKTEGWVKPDYDLTYKW